MSVTVVTSESWDKGRDVFAAAGGCIRVAAEPASIAPAITGHGADSCVLGVEPYDAALYAALPRGGVIARFGVGLDNLDLAAATAAGILVTNTPGVLERYVAEFAIAQIGALARNLCQLSAQLAAGTWAPRPGHGLAGRRLAVLGCGAIGSLVARMAHGLGLEIIAFDARPLSALNGLAGVPIARYTTDLHEAVVDADIVSLHLALTAETRRLCDAAFFAAMKPGAHFVNTARGGLVDELALFSALRNGPLAAAALDVFNHEPYRPAAPDADLRSLENVLLTPHIASNTHSALRAMAERCLANIQAARERRFADLDLVNPEVLAS